MNQGRRAYRRTYPAHDQAMGLAHVRNGRDNCLGHTPRQNVVDFAGMIQIASDHGTGDRQIEAAAASYRHDLDVFAPGRTIAAAIAGMQPLLDSEQSSLERTQRSMADTERRIIRKQRSIAPRIASANPASPPEP
jgi:hypothetical protein